MSAKDWRRLAPDDWTQFQKSMLQDRGGERQQRFLEVMGDAREFVSFVRQGLRVEGMEKPPLFPERMAEGQFREMPRDIEAALLHLWGDLSLGIASRGGFWADLALRHVEMGRIDAMWLAGKAGSKVPAKRRVDQALRREGKDIQQDIDDCVRSALRRLGGISVVRGVMSVYADCPFARAWWRESWTNRISEQDNDLAEQVWQVLAKKQNRWEILVGMAVQRNSVFGSERIWDSLVRGLAIFSDGDSGSPLLQDKPLTQVRLSIGLTQASRELDVLEDDELQELMDGILKERGRLAMESARSSEIS